MDRKREAIGWELAARGVRESIRTIEMTAGQIDALPVVTFNPGHPCAENSHALYG